MERLWSPWRLAYVTGKTGDKDRCVFCDAADPAPDPSGQDSLVLVRGARAYVILNLYPYNNGHLMVVPNRHVASLVDRYVKIGAQNLDEQRRNRQVCRSGRGVPIPLAPCLQMPTHEGLYRLEHGPVWR